MVQRITCLRDNESEICSSLRISLEKSPSFIMITGGLGPTRDDLSLRALAKLSGKSVVVSELVLRVMSERRMITADSFNTSQLKMMSTLEGAECLPNPLGWAPLTILKIGESTIILMPGPPRETQACFNEHLAKRIEDATGLRSYGRRVRVTMFESELAPLVEEMAKTFKGIYIKPLVADSTRELGLPVEVLAFDCSEEGCRQKCDAAVISLKKLIVQRGKDLFEI